MKILGRVSDPKDIATKEYVDGKASPYGTCSTAAGTAAKTVTVNSDSFTLETGVSVRVKFSNANSASSPTLNVNGTGAKAIKRYGTTAVSTSAASSWNAGSILELTYDGTNWIINNFLNTTYSSMSVAEYEAGTATSARLITPARLKAAILHWASGKDHSHDYLPLSGGSLTGQVLFDTGTNQSATKGLKWSPINSKNPYIGYALNQTDGTFLLCSLLGTNYQDGLAIGGGSGNLLWKGVKVATANDITTYTHPTTSGNKHIPSGGSSGQYLKWSADGTAVWADAPSGGETSAADYVIEKGTINDEWYYQKWSSGRVECWCRLTKTVSSWTAWGNLYYASVASISYPFTFVTIPTQEVTVTSPAGSGWGCNYNNTETGTGTIQILRNNTTGGSVNFKVHIYVRGNLT